MFRENSLKRDLAAGKMVCGCAVMSRSPLIVEMLGYTGFDWLFIDTEHVPIGSDTTLEHLIRAAEASNIVPVVRVKENREQYIRNALEAGAQGRHLRLGAGLAPRDLALLPRPGTHPDVLVASAFSNAILRFEAR